MPQNQELCFTDGAMPVLPTVRVLVGHAGRSPALCQVKPRSHRGCHQPLQCSDVSFPMCMEGKHINCWGFSGLSRQTGVVHVGSESYLVSCGVPDLSHPPHRTVLCCMLAGWR